MNTVDHRHGWNLLCAVLAGFATFGCNGSERGSGRRSPRWPLKTTRTLRTNAQITRVRRLCETNEAAGAVRRRICDAASYWTAIPDAELRRRLPDARVPRAFNVSTEGCPEHGKAIYTHGTYPWKLDREHPFTVICPIGGESYPSNDFEAYYRSGMRDPTQLTGPHADAGRGWPAPNGARYWFVAYACHWHWLKTWLPAVKTLSQAYVLTGDPLYARKALVMLDRIAEVYPGMDYCTQCRLAAETGTPKHGKIVNSIWATDVLRDLAIAYDQVFDALLPVSAKPSGRGLYLADRTTEQIRANIEANLLEEGIDAVQRHQICGNFGMHQAALAYAAVVRQHGPTHKLLDGIFTHTGLETHHEGLDYALYNLVYKDGMPLETSPLYCFTWLDSLVQLARPLSIAGIDLYEHPKLRRLFDAPLQMVCAGAFTPAIGDAGGLTSGWIGPNAATYEAAFRRLREPQYAWALHRLGARPGRRFETFEDLFAKPVADAAASDARLDHPRPHSRVLDGYGLAVLNNPNDSVAVAMYYGMRDPHHGHFDRLNIELFAHGRRLSPDLGYPDFMNDLVPGIHTWTKNTVSHNCVIVNESRQRGYRPAKVLRLHDSPTVHVVDVDAFGTYAQTDVYRRTLVLVDVGPDDAYLVDVFRVHGGESHTLSLHGPEGTFHLDGLSLPPPVTEGTLAGRNVAYGNLYDDPVRGDPGYHGGYAGYKGSGFQHFFNWQQATPETFVCGCWQTEGSPAGQLRVHVAPHPEQALIVADAYVSPTRKIPTTLKYMLLRRSATESGNTFVTVWEPAGTDPLIDRVEMQDAPSLGTGHDRTVVLQVYRAGTVDCIVVGTGEDRLVSFGPEAQSDATIVVTSEQNGSWTRAFAAGGTKLIGTEPNGSIAVPETILGEIRSVDYANQRLEATVSVEGIDVTALTGRIVRIFNARHSCVYTIASAEATPAGLRLTLTGSDVFTGRIRIHTVKPAQRIVTTYTCLPHRQRLAGMHLVTDDLRHAAPITAIDGNAIHLEGSADLKAFAAGVTPASRKDAWIADFGVRDRIEIERFVYRETGFGKDEAQ